MTCYHHKDANNEWIVKKPWGIEAPGEAYDGEPEFIEDSHIVRLGITWRKRSFQIYLGISQLQAQ